MAQLSGMVQEATFDKAVLQWRPYLCLIGLPVGLSIVRCHDFLILLLSSLLCGLLSHAAKHTHHHERQQNEHPSSSASCHRHDLAG